MSDQSSNLAFPFLMPAQAQKHVTVNESLLRLDALVQLAVVSATTAAQPASPADGARYILPAGKTGAAWGAMATGALAYYRHGAWEELSPREGFIAYVKDSDSVLAHDGAAWVALPIAIPDGAITDAKLRDSAALSVIGRASDSSGDPADIAAADGEVLRRAGTSLGFGQLALAALPDDLVTYAKLQNVSATDRLLGRDTTGAGDIEELTISGGLEFTGSGGIRTSAFTGDVTKSAGGTVLSIADDAVTFAKLNDATQACFIGAAGAGAFAERTYAQVRSDLGLVIGTNVQAYDADLTTLGAGGSGARDFLALGAADAVTHKTLALTQGTITDPADALTITATWNDAADTFFGASIDITNTASGANSQPFRVRVGRATLFSIGTSGFMSATAGAQMQASSYWGWGGRARFYSPADAEVNVRNAANSAYGLVRASAIYTNDTNFMHRTLSSLTNGAGALTGTLSNSPATGNPTKWIPIDDNGTTRYVPAW